ncbi:S8 family serine peptidase [Litoribaculum gwangyangense]|uniref:S8 family serine peptidase n=1 Tax=Litoribaculum gwangyangense TaxID=1130722 RepID=A0ABP9CLF7_9FLAO
MKNLIFLIFIFCFKFRGFSQQDAWVYLTGKQNVSESISNPISILTQKAIDRKNTHNIAIDFRDVPVNENYITQLKNAAGITVMAKSKWFNAVHVRGSQMDIQALSSLGFVASINFADKSLNTVKTSYKNKTKSKLENVFTAFNYGNAANQIQMLKGNTLHLFNYTGAGMTVAVLDAGFPNVNTMSAFQRLRNGGKILGGYDFVNRDDNVYANVSSSHGTWVLSTMAGYIENQYVGTAPDASYYLFITEDAPNENPVEESYWVEAAERADSLGVDVINTSLGYTTFDNPNYNYSMNDMDGNTAFITKGANIAFEKGMLLINSAGNSGNDSWQIVGAPADAAGVLSIGAVDSYGIYASFSSRGSSLQPTQKPDVVAQGLSSYVIGINDAIGTLNGTSFSAPILAGGVVCLWQALPQKTNTEIMQIVRESASQYSNPDYYLGYGIPDLEFALNLGFFSVSKSNENESIFLYPNPSRDKIFVKLPDSIENSILTIFDVLGKMIATYNFSKGDNEANISSLSKGMYLAKIEYSGGYKSFKIIKE